ncbi:N-acetyl-gamma-glutamyl-phosphate reductase [Halosquirtibacter xylanolyticus]|uniref:N-acetyl-gamma-glutamyl-phosphate reductase n=1 Tax=Halosquirtibacter xylanolyticus TaxID=3374599 RepID=UPI003747864F|nr:N-acetyl-gamma-glutamyl-phosphate reductase [Prolixibacteraceae bacterium]
MDHKISVGIVGGAGYTAGELLRILLFHPYVQITHIQSGSYDGKLVTEVHKDLIGETNIRFSDIEMDHVDTIFLCMGHGKSKEYMEKTDIPSHVKIIDLSHDYRLKAKGNDFVYGLPELNRETIAQAQHIANPGCFATGIQLALLPLANAQLLKDDIHIQAITGSTGAGQAPSRTSHFSWRNNNLSVYKAFSHQHLGEIGQSITQLQPDFNHDINFIPLRGNHTRGIFVSAYTQYSGSLEAAQACYKSYYASHPFVHVVEENPDLKQVVNTNKALVYLEVHQGKLMILTCTDNLLKGASGQAVQNLNILYGLDEFTGLHLKPSVF